MWVFWSDEGSEGQASANEKGPASTEAGPFSFIVCPEAMV
jgi:hypothetical protein